MNRPALKPSDFPCLLSEAPPGLFLYLGRPGMRTALDRPNGTALAYDEDGAPWDLGDNVVVQPVRVIWTEGT